MPAYCCSGSRLVDAVAAVASISIGRLRMQHVLYHSYKVRDCDVLSFNVYVCVDVCLTIDANTNFVRANSQFICL